MKQIAINFLKFLQGSVADLPEKSAISSVELNNFSDEEIRNERPEIIGEVNRMEKTVEQNLIEQEEENREIKPDILISQQTHENPIKENKAIDALDKSTAEITKISREFYKHTSAIQDNSYAVKELNDNLQQTQGQLEEILINQRQENGELKRELNAWATTSIEFFSLLERAVDGQEDEKKKLVQKILNEFERTVKLRGLDRIIPQPDDPLAEKFHEAIDVEESSNITSLNILRCATVGYRIGSNVLKKAKVIIAKSPATATEEVAIKASETLTTEPVNFNNE